MPDEEERVGEGEGSKLEFELELEPAEEEGLAWPNTVEEAVVAGLVSLVREIGEKSEVRSRIGTYLPCPLPVNAHPNGV